MPSMGIKIDYLLAACFMSAPGGILMAKIIMPDVDRGARTASCRSATIPRTQAIALAEATP